MDALNLISQGFGLGTNTADTDYIGFDGIFKSDARSEEKESGKSTVANFYVEDGSQVSDHVIIDAKQLTVSGEISDVFYQKSLLTNSYSQATDALGNIAIYLPNKTLSQVSTINKYVNDYQNTYRKVEDFQKRFNKFGEYLGAETGNDTLKTMIVKDSGSSKSVQAEFIKFIREYQITKRPMKVETIRFGIFKDMMITDYSFSNNGDDDSTKYTINFQQIRKTQTIVTPVKLIAKNANGKQAGIQTSDKQDKGVAQGTDKEKVTEDSSLASKAWTAVKGLAK